MSTSNNNSEPYNEKSKKELDISSANPDQIREVKKFISDFIFIPGPELKDIRIPILSPPGMEDVPGSEPEPVYGPAAQDDIQGNIIPGFNKDHQHFLFYRIGNPKQCKKFLKWLVPYLSSMEEVLAFRRLFRSKKLKLGEKGIFLCSTWVNIAFSNYGIELLTNKEDAKAFGDQSFRQGLAQRSLYLGDPADKDNRGHASRWVVGGPKNEADIIVIVASDNPAMLEEMVSLINVRAGDANMTLLFEQRGDTLPGTLRGHEHFGFKDGISQPGIRGKLSTAPGDYITPRYIANTDPRRLFFAKPGQLLAWPGQFLLGELRQNTEHLSNSAAAANNFPKWAARGSYLVVRRLHQEVLTFWHFALSAAATLGIDAIKFASMLVGRWPSGAPLMRTPGIDNPTLAEDGFANNHFIFDDNTIVSSLRPIPGYPGDTFPGAMADFLATVCPHFAHIRKINARDSVTDLGKPEDNLVRMILRRGIPYGPPVLNFKKLTNKLLETDRGLMFLSYGGSIEDQFEFLQRRWANSPVQPNLGGQDPIIGQNGNSRSRERFIDFPATGGAIRIKFKNEWVIPTGGGYFFSPTISAVRDVLGV